MSAYYCHECQQPRNRKWHGAHENPLDVGGDLICEDCLHDIEHLIAEQERPPELDDLIYMELTGGFDYD